MLRQQIANQRRETQNSKISTERLEFDKVYDPKYISNTSSQIRGLSESKRQEILLSNPTTSRIKTQQTSVKKTPKNFANYSYESRLLLTPNESMSKARRTSNTNLQESTHRNKFTESIIVNKKPYSERQMNFLSQNN